MSEQAEPPLAGSCGHLCHVYETDAERLELLAGFVAGGLRAGEACAVALDGADREPLRAALAAAGISPAELERLELYEQDAVYLPDGRFDAARASSFWAGVHERARRGGLRLRIAGLGDWSERAQVSAEEVGRYEAAINPLVESWGIRVACLYDRRRTSVAVLEEVLRQHPAVSWGGTTIANPYYLPAAADCGAARLGWKLEHLRAQCAEHRELEQSERRLRHVLANTADVTLVLNVDGRIDFLSVGAARLFERDATELLGTCAWDLLHRDDRLLAESELRQLAGRPGATRRLELRLWLQRGERTMEVTATNLLPDASVGGILVNLHDVTERTTVLHALRDSEERLRELADTVEGVFWISHPEASAPVYVSRAYERIFGAPVEEVLRSAESWLGRVHPEDRERVRATFSRRDELAESEYRVVRPDGGVRWIWDRAYPVRDEEGRVLRVVGLAEDVTERVQAREALEFQRVMLQAILDNLPVMVTVYDADGRLTMGNRCWTETMGWTVEEAQALDLLSAVHLDAASRARGEMMVRQASGRWADFTLRTRYGAELHTSWAYLRLPDGTGISIGQDISHRIAAIEALEAARRRAEALLDGLPDPAWLKDAGGRYIAANEALARAAGLAHPAEVIGRTDPELFTPEQAALYAASDAAVLRLGERLVTEDPMTGPDGELRIMETVKLPYCDHAGAFAGTVGIARDVSERKRSERELQQSREQYRLMVEGSPGVFFYRHDVHGRFEYLSPSVQGVLGYAPAELLGQSWEVLHTGDPADERARLETARLLRTGSGLANYLAVNRTRDGRTVSVEITESAVIEDDVVVGVQGFARDVTERAMLEDRLRQSQKMEAIGTLAGGVAHDFNNILTAIIGHADLLEDQLAQAGVEAPDVREIRRGAERASDLTRQLLAFSRRQMLQPIVLDLRQVLSELRRMLLRVIREDIELSVHSATELWPVRADRTQLDQIIMNLAVNARDAIRGGGQIEITTRNVGPQDPLAARYDWLRSGDHVMLEVRDTGSGIAPEHLPHIFEPFFTTKPAGAGTGLGLATVYGIVEQSGGRLELETECGVGTTFRVFLPRSADAPVVNAATPAPVAGGRRACTILVVEDEPAVRRLAVRILGRGGHHVLEAENGEAAMALLAEKPAPIDLLLTDLVMPRVGGRQLAEHVRAVYPGVEVIFMSGYSEEMVIGGELGLVHEPFLEKPFTPAALLACVDRVRATAA